MIQVVDVHKSFGGQQVLKGVNLEFTTGKITTIVGTSGCGKTVLLKHLNALLLPDRGEILVDNVDITKLRKSYTQCAADSASFSRGLRCSIP